MFPSLTTPNIDGINFHIKIIVLVLVVLKTYVHVMDNVQQTGHWYEINLNNFAFAVHYPAYYMATYKRNQYLCVIDLNSISLTVL